MKKYINMVWIEAIINEYHTVVHSKNSKILIINKEIIWTCEKKQEKHISLIT